MIWTLRIAKRAEKLFAKAPAKSRRLLQTALEEMCHNPYQWRHRSPKIRALYLAPPCGKLSDFFDVYPDEQMIDIVDIDRRTTTTYK